MDLKMDQENAVHHAPLQKPGSDLGLSVKPKIKSVTKPKHKSSTAFTDVHRKALGNISNVNRKNDVIQKPKTGLSIRTEQQACSTLSQADTIVSKLSALATPIEQDKEDWPEIEFQPHGDPESDDEEAWQNMSLEHMTSDDVARLYEWQPKVDLSKPQESSPSLQIECPDLKLECPDLKRECPDLSYMGWSRTSFKIFEDCNLEADLDNEPLAYVPLD